IFVEHRAWNEPVFCAVSDDYRRRLRSFSEPGSVSAARLLRNRDLAEIPVDRRLGIDESRLRGDEADALFDRRKRARARGRDGGLCGGGDWKFWFVGFGWRGVFGRVPSVGVSGDVPRIRGAGGDLAAAHLGADR